MTEFKKFKEEPIDHFDIPRLLSEKIIRENIQKNRLKRPKGANADKLMQDLGGLKDD